MICSPDQIIIPKKSKGGRKSIRLSKSMIKDIQSMISKGYMEKQVIQALGVSHQIFYKWKGSKIELQTAIEAGKRVALIDVEDSLRKMALGDTEITEIISMKNSAGKVVSTVEKVKKPGPDFRAIQFSLVNGLPGKYRDEGKGDVNVTLLQAPTYTKTDNQGTSQVEQSKEIKQIIGDRTAQPVSALLPIDAGVKRVRNDLVQDGKEQLPHGVKMLQSPADRPTGPRNRKNAVVIEKKSPEGGGGGRGAAERTS